MATCPECGRDDVDRIGAYEYRCNNCENVFDASEVDDSDDDEEDW